MNSEFPRILSLLRKEKGISQKKVAGELGISQALLSHYEKGIRECGLDFLIRCADYYGVSCDYLLGRSPERNGATLTVDMIPDAETVKETSPKLGLVLLLKKKLIFNSINVLLDLSSKTGHKGLVTSISDYLMLHVYKLFRDVYQANPKNQNAMFTIPTSVYSPFCDAGAKLCEAKMEAIFSGKTVGDVEGVSAGNLPLITTESLDQEYPLYASSLLNLIQNSESLMGSFAEKRS